MDLTTLTSILSRESGEGHKFCCICGTPFKPYHSRQKTCSSPDCRRQAHNAYMRDRRKRLIEKDPEAWRKYRREAMRRYRGKKRELIARDRQLKELEKHWQRQAEFDRKISEYGMEYGERQKMKTLASVPKIDVNLEGRKDDTLHTESDTAGSR